MIDVIDYRAGNAPSVMYALERLGLDCRLVAKPEEIAESERLVLPGVGAAGATLDSLRESDLLDALDPAGASDGVPFLGICIGLQVLFEHSEEGDTACLGWLPGRSAASPTGTACPRSAGTRCDSRGRTRSPPGSPTGPLLLRQLLLRAARRPRRRARPHRYGVEFRSVVAHDNIVATQFHAEKSGALGLALLADFAAWDGRC